MKSAFLISFLSLFLSINGYSQTPPSYYYYQGQQINVTRNFTKQFVLTTATDSSSLMDSLNMPNLVIEEFRADHPGNLTPYQGGSVSPLNWAIISSGSLSSFNLNQLPSIEYSAPYLSDNQGNSFGQGNYFIVDLHNLSDTILLDSLSQLYNADIVGYNPSLPLKFTLTCDESSTSDALGLSALFYESGYFKSSQPDWLVQIELATCSSPPNDPLFSDQWSFDNTGSIPGSVAGIDINVTD